MWCCKVNSREARWTLDQATRWASILEGRRNFLLKKFVDMEEIEIAYRTGALDDLAVDDLLEEAIDFEKGDFLFLEF
ncbi:hypothetical protein RHMOL_Rhmol03G0256100 [Rhododendron molle]|uniref:Uncharacterized protein n=1 Tax=Rhododendron molle TaxID=49168 RepID=A0ACC0PJT2_RHOML|nr:hypothetical protein RHMOL_Rhmol03G0256100 [Rhododendron molle]